MAQLSFKIQAEWDKVQRLREEIAKLKQEIGKTDAIQNPTAFNKLNSKLQQTGKELGSVTGKIAQASATMETDFKQKIFAASQGVNDFTEKIIAQKAVVKDVAADVRRLGESYREAKKYSPMSAAGKLAEWKSAKRALEEEKATLFGLTQEQATARLSVKKLRDEYASLRQEGGGTAETMNLLTSKMKQMGVAVMGGIGLKELASRIISVRSEFESMETSLKVLLGGNEERLKSIMSQIKEYALASPLNTQDMVGAVQMMTSFGIEAEKSIDYLKAIGDISMGDTGKFNGLALAFSQMSSAGKLMGQDLMQMVNAGFNPLEEMSRKTGKSIGQLKEEMSKGAISAQMVQDAFISATSAGGKFYGMSQEGAKTLNGQISMLQESFDNMFNEIGEKGQPIVMDAVKLGTSLVENYERVGRVLLGLVTVYGTYRTALAIATFSQNGHTFAMTLARTQILLTQKAQALLNATMLANPYVLAATALGALVGVMIISADTTKAAEDALERYNEKVKENADKVKEEKDEIDKLISTLEDETSSIESKNIAFSTLIAKYPTIFGKYKTEKELIDNLVEARQRENAEIERKTALLGQKTYSDSKTRANDLNRLKYLQENGDIKGRQTQSGYKKGKDQDEYFRLWYKYHDDIKKTQTWYGTESSAIDRLASVASEEYKLNINENRKSQIAKYNANIGNLSKAQAEKELAKLRSNLKKMEKSGKDYLTIGNNEPLSRAQIKERITLLENNVKTERKTMAQWRKEAENETKKNRKTAKDLASSTELFTKDQAEKKMKQANSELATSEKAEGNFKVKDKAGDKASKEAEKKRKEQIKEEKAQQKAKDDLNSKSIAKSQSQVELENQVEQSRIDAMKEGHKKTLATMALAHKKELEQIEKQKLDYLKKKQEEAKAVFYADPKNKDKTFDTSYVTLSENELSKFNEMRKNAEAKYVRENKEYNNSQLSAMREYLIEYGSIQEQKEAINAEYNQKILDADNIYIKAKLSAEKESKLYGLDFKEMQDRINWEDVFKNIELHSTGYLKSIKNKLRDALNVKEITVEDAKILTNKIQEIEKTIGDRTDVWGAILPGLRERKQLTEETVLAQEALNKAIAEQAGASLKVFGDKIAIQEGLKSAGINAELDDINEANMDSLLSSMDKGTPLYNGLLELFKNLATDKVIANKKSQEVSTARTSLNAQWDKLKSMNSITDVFGVESGNPLEIAKIANENIQSMKDFTETLGIENTDFGVAVGQFAEGSNEMMNAVGSLMSGDVIGAVNHTVKGFQAWADMFKGGSKHEKQLAIQEDISKKMDILNESINRLTDKLDKSYGIEAIKTKEELDKQIKSNQQYYWQGLDAAGADNYGKGRQDWYHWNKNNRWMAQDIAESYGLGDIESWQDLFNKLSNLEDGKGAEILNDIRTNHSLDWWYTMQTQGYNGGVMGDWLNKWADSWDKIEESGEKLRQRITGTTEDNVFSDFMNSLYALADGSEDVFDDISDNWQKMVNKMVLNNIIGSKYQEELKDWYTKFSKAYSEDGSIDKDELGDLKKEYNEIMKSAADEVKALKNIGLIEEVDGNSSQKATINEARNLSEDTGSKIDGRLTAVQIANEQRNAKLDVVNSHLSLMSSTMADIKAAMANNAETINIADETRTILADSYLELKAINENTGNSAAHLKELRSDMKELKKIVNDRL